MTSLGARGLDPVEVFDALGIGWGVHELYPDPVKQRAFVSAVDRLAALRDSTITYEIGAGSISCEQQELSVERGGTARLSLRLFVHEIEWLELLGAPTANELNEFFNLLAADEDLTRSNGGIAQALQGRDVWSIVVTQRGLLVEGLENPWEEREADQQEDAGDGGARASKLARMITGGASAEEVAQTIVGEAGGDIERIAESFCDAFRTIYPEAVNMGVENESVTELLTAYRHAPRARPPVDTLAETFFLIPVDAQARVLADFLANRSQGLHGLLLDQFAGLELAELVPHLAEETFNELVEYARDVVESETGSADELLPMVSAARDVKAARLTAADRIRQMIEGIGGLEGAPGGLALQLREENSDTAQLGRFVLRVLFEIEDRPDRFGRMVESWCGRISNLVGEGELDRAIGLLRAGREKPDLSQTKRRVIDTSLAEMLRSDYAVFNQAGQDPARHEALGGLLGAFGEPAAAHLMERLTIEDDPASRRILIGLLVVVGSSYPDPIVGFFRDDEWFVVRNAVTIAGRIGGDSWVEHLNPLLEHSDHRVVIEVLRALTPIAPDGAVAELVQSLAHTNDRVQETAFLLLQASTSQSQEARLVEALTDRGMDGARGAVAGLLFDLGTPTALGALQDIARKPFLIRATHRAARRAARDVLGSAA